MLKSILLVEDDPQTTYLYVKFMETAWEASHGKVDFITTHTIEGMREILAKQSIDIILLDLTLGDSFQVETIAMIGNENKTLPPIIVVTGDERLETRHACIAAGAKGFALKKHVNGSPNFFFAEVYNIFLESSKITPTQQDVPEK